MRSTVENCLQNCDEKFLIQRGFDNSLQFLSVFPTYANLQNFIYSHISLNLFHTFFASIPLITSKHAWTRQLQLLSKMQQHKYNIRI